MTERVKRARNSVNYAALDEGLSSGDDDFFDMGGKQKSKQNNKKKKEKKRKFALSDSDDDFIENRESLPKKPVKDNSSRLPLSPKVPQATQAGDALNKSNSKRLSREERLFQKELERALAMSKVEVKGAGLHDSGLDIDVTGQNEEGVSPDRKQKSHVTADPVSETPTNSSSRTESEFRLRINATEGSVIKISSATLNPDEAHIPRLPVPTDHPEPKASLPERKKETPKVEKKKSSKLSSNTTEKRQKESLPATPQLVASTPKPSTSTVKASSLVETKTPQAGPSSSRTSRTKSVTSVETKRSSAAPVIPRTPSLPSAAVSNNASPLEALSAFSRMSGIRVGLSRSTPVKSLLKN